MKLLFDQNISFRILKKINHEFPDAVQVRLLGLENSPDRKIWEFAKEKNYAIVTFDADFYELSNIYGHPPKIIWLRTGNTTTNYIADLLINQKHIIQEFLSNDEYRELACIEIE